MMCQGEELTAVNQVSALDPQTEESSRALCPANNEKPSLVKFAASISTPPPPFTKPSPAGSMNDRPAYNIVLPDGTLKAYLCSALKAEEVLRDFPPDHYLTLSATRPLRLPSDTLLLRWNTYYVHRSTGGAVREERQHERKSLRALHRRNALGGLQHTTGWGAASAISERPPVHLARPTSLQDLSKLDARTEKQGMAAMLRPSWELALPQRVPRRRAAPSAHVTGPIAAPVSGEQLSKYAMVNQWLDSGTQFSPLPSLTTSPQLKDVATLARDELSMAPAEGAFASILEGSRVSGMAVSNAQANLKQADVVMTEAVDGCWTPKPVHSVGKPLGSKTLLLSEMQLLYGVEEAKFSELVEQNRDAQRPWVSARGPSSLKAQPTRQTRANKASYAPRWLAHNGSARVATRARSATRDIGASSGDTTTCKEGFSVSMEKKLVGNHRKNPVPPRFEAAKRRKVHDITRHGQWNKKQPAHSCIDLRYLGPS